MTESAERVVDRTQKLVSGAIVSSRAMRAVRIHRFGGLEVIVHEELPRPVPAQGQVLVRVKAAGVGPWDARIRSGGVLVSAVDQPDPAKAAQRGIPGVFFLVAVSAGGVMRIGELLDAGQLRTNVGDVRPLCEARLAHEMRAGRPHKPGDIVLAVEARMLEAVSPSRLGT
jgi:NADPH:quinone reductase-like Zn-dependent oxidoreductase